MQHVELSDAGTYRCLAENPLNSTSESGVLLVRRQTRIERPPVDLQVNAGLDATFNCSATTDAEEVGSSQPAALA